MTTICSNSYDPWGKLVNKNGVKAAEDSDPNDILSKNPFRYRGYRYDNETGFYYLNSRFYDPGTRRFISSDVYDIALSATNGITDKNLYNYCDNNPVIRADEGGDFWHIVVGAAVGAGIEITGQLMSGKSLQEVDYAEVGVAAASGGLSAALGPLGAFLLG